MRKLLLKTQLSLGDIVVMTAMVRDLHRCYPGQFLTDVRTTCKEVWDHNPHLTPLDERDPEVEVVACEYPLIEWSNQVPFHFLHGFVDHLNARLNLEVKVTEFRGDIHLSAKERRESNPTRDWLGEDVPYWLILAGGKHDVTIKWWDHSRYQEVVDRFRGRIQFVQLGQAGDHHPALRGVLDLRGRTRLRDLIRWTHHADGVLCGVTGLMHLAAAVPRAKVEGREGLLPCVVVAGGREPVHWEAYPGHQFHHTIGMLSCCAQGGCWRSRTRPLGDGDPRDQTSQLCVNVKGDIPECMDRIRARDVAESIEHYLEGGQSRQLNRRVAARMEKRLKQVPANPYDRERLVAGNVRSELERVLSVVPPQPGMEGRAILMGAGGHQLATCAYVNVRMLREVGCKLPVEIWHLGENEMPREWRKAFEGLNVVFRDATRLEASHGMRRLSGWELKIFAMLNTGYRELLWLDADNVVVRNPEYLFETKPYLQSGAVFWPDNAQWGARAEAWKLFGLKETGRPFETGQMLIDKSRCWDALHLVKWINSHSDFFYRLTWGDKETFRLGFLKTGTPFAMPRRSPRGAMRQYDFDDRVVFQHRNTDKWTLYFEPRRIPGFVGEDRCREFLLELAAFPGMRISLGSPKGKLKKKGLALGAMGRGGNADVVEADASMRLKLGARAAVVQGGRRRGSSAFWIVMSYDAGMASVGECASAAWSKYAQAWGFGFHLEQGVVRSGRHPAWNKIRAMLRAFESGASCAMWVDADTYPMNGGVDASALMERGKDAVFATDFNGLNSGIFLMRNTEWSRRFLESVDFLGDVRVNPDGYGDKWEQNTIKAVLGSFKGHGEHVKLVKPRVLNSSVWDYEPGDFILHLGGMSQRDRLHYLKQLSSPTSRAL